ncbi:hypothetical protein CGCS363_v001463 [Colletotrichum siamense]|uniref:uncharacterized protein n=1 Tax=Colletotrichum siamense TaxID=690259 RepID=UPI0018721CFF|nr:uncharacterized protein CGCS363_v001463 [Colletotrichum siamense]KAF5516238.1 hypothetical protein CGCS363_v001463 [Colletotrichum siamense]
MEAAIGIIGLSLQLIDSAVKVRRVIGTYRSASSEINRLALKVERVEAICGAIRKNFEKDDTNLHCSDVIETWGICVLQSIQSTLEELHVIVAKLERRASKPRALHTVGFFFLEKKDEIKKLSAALDGDLNDLQHMMTAELLSRFGVVEQLLLPHQTRPSKPQRQLVSGVNVTSTALLVPGTSEATERDQIDTTRRIGFFGEFKTTKITRKSRLRDLHDLANVQESKTYSFGIRGISTRIELRWALDTKTPISYSLSLQHSIAREINPQLLIKVTNIIGNGDLRGLQTMFSNREIIPTSFIASMTLFEYAAAHYQPTICHFLARQNFRQCLGEDEVLQEFKNFGAFGDYPPSRTFRNWDGEGFENNTRQHILWKTETTGYEADAHWPFALSTPRDRSCDDLRGWDLFDDKPTHTPNAIRSFHYAKELFQKRFEKRSLKKLCKSGYLKKQKRLKIPGAWEDSQW